jgi:hypothetical protein
MIFQRLTRLQLAAGLGPLAETIGIGRAALPDFVAAETISYDIDGFLQAEIRQAGKDLSGGRVTRAGDVLEIAYVLSDTGSDFAPNGCRGHSDCDALALPDLTGDVDAEHQIRPPSEVTARIGPPEKPSGEWQLSKMTVSSEERPTMRHSLSPVILCGVRFEYPAGFGRLELSAGPVVS